LVDRAPAVWTVCITIDGCILGTLEEDTDGSFDGTLEGDTDGSFDSDLLEDGAKLGVLLGLSEELG
jgi:hypothetical protein